MILTAFTPWLSANVRADGKLSENATAFNPEGSVFPSYPVFRDVLSRHVLTAGSRICVVSSVFEDREIGLMLFAASRRAVSTAIRVSPRSENQPGRLHAVPDNLKMLGLPVQENSLQPLKLSGPTVIAIDRRAWSVSVPLSETLGEPVEVESAPWTAAEVCGWARSAQSAKAATVR
jgi:hypothetical protein